MEAKNWQAGLDLIDKIFLGCLLIVFTLIFLHAPITVVFGGMWPDASLYIKAWKEIIMLLALVGAVFILWRDKKWSILDNWLVKLLVAYVLLGVIMAVAFYKGPAVTFAGLLIDYRYIFAFFLFYIAGRIYPQFRPLLIKAGAVGIGIVVIFGLLQVFVLPHDVLKYIGYNKEVNIAPYQTVDENYDFIRINSTLRGPNVLGALMVVAVAAIVSYGLKYWQKIHKNRRLLIWLGLLLTASLVSLWASYSRSAWGATVLAIFATLGLFYGKKIKKQHIIAVAIIGLLALGGLYVVKDTAYISNILLHEDPYEAGLINSNDGHAESLAQGSDLLLKQPIGAGIGSTGSASLLTDNPLIIENQYLFIAHELGWMGLAIFIGLSGTIMYLLCRIWQKNKDWLVLAVFASGIGLILIGFVLPVWADDTVSIVWWSLAGYLLGEYKPGVRRKNGKSRQ